MNKEKALVMLAEVTDFLCYCKALPAYKATDHETERAERQLANKLGNLIARIEDQLVQALLDKGFIPSTSADQEQFILRFASEIYEEFDATLTQTLNQEYEKGQQIALEDLQKAGIVPKPESKATKGFRDKLKQFVNATFNSVVRKLSKVLSKEKEKGSDLATTVRALREEFRNLRENDLRQVARMGINSIKNEAIYDTLRDNGAQYKQWITARDDRVRPSHVALHGEVVRVDEPFSNGLMFPGDHSGSIEEWINCRCRIRLFHSPKNPKVQTPFRP